MPVKNRFSQRFHFCLMALVLIVGAVSATTYTLWRLRSATVERHFDAANQHARAFENHLTHTFDGVELIMANALTEGGAAATSQGALTAALHRAPYLRSLSMTDTRGVIVASSDRRNIGVRVGLNDFLPQTDPASAQLRIGLPWSGHDFYDGRAATSAQPVAPEARGLLPVARSLGAHGAGMLLAAVNTDYFLNYYANNVEPQQGVVELLRYDGTVLLSTDPLRRPGTRMHGGPLLERIASDVPGHFEQDNVAGRVVLTAYRSARNYPFAVVVQLDKDQSLEGWRHELGQTVGVVGVVVVVALLFAGLYFVRLERVARRHEADLGTLRLRGAALEAAANSIIITNHQGTIEWVNPAFCALSGYRLHEVLGRTPRALVHSGVQDPAVYQDLWRTILAGEVWHGEMINRRKDQSLYTEDQTITPVRNADGKVSHFIAIKQDITERKQVEQRMAELSRHLVVVQESARRRLSGELHDRTSPNLASIGVHLNIITADLQVGDASMLDERLADVRALIEDTTASIREICSDLRPPVLDYSGLQAALEHYVGQFRRRTNMVVTLRCTPAAARLAPALESALFRIVQEALTNCAKHSRAQSIGVEWGLDGGHISLTVSDDGVGFDPSLLGKTTHTGGLGLLLMKEMSEFLGGKFALESTPGTGTRITVEIHAAHAVS